MQDGESQKSCLDPPCDAWSYWSILTFSRTDLTSDALSYCQLSPSLEQTSHPPDMILRQKNTPAGKSRSTAMPRAPGGPTAEMLKAAALDVLLKCADAIPCCNLGLTATEFQVGTTSCGPMIHPFPFLTASIQRGHKRLFPGHLRLCAGLGFISTKACSLGMFCRQLPNTRSVQKGTQCQTSGRDS